MHDEHCSANSEACECDLRRELEERIAALEAERDAARKEAADWQSELERLGSHTVDAIAELQAERDALRADAERYRWIISQAWFQDEAEFRLSLSDEEESELYIEEINAAIDAARKQEKKNGD